jgi:uncharacterized protein YbaP (TraB family)
MKKKCFLLTGIWFILCAGFAQSSVWKVAKNGNTIYLGGSIHLLRAEDYPLPEEFEIAFNQSAQVVLEADIKEMNEQEILQRMQTSGFLPGNETLKTLLDEDVYEQLEAVCTGLGLPLENFLKMKPSLLMNIVSVLQFQRIGFLPEGIDIYYYQKASQNGIKLEFLETMDFQMDMLFNMAEGYENEFVKYSLSEFSTMEEKVSEFIAEWRKGDSKKLTEEFDEMKKQFPLVYKALMTERNNNWIHKIDTYILTPETEFIIVGLGHFYGEDGLLSQLEKNGYKVEKLEIKETKK